MRKDRLVEGSGLGEGRGSRTREACRMKEAGSKDKSMCDGGDEREEVTGMKRA